MVYLTLKRLLDIAVVLLLSPIVLILALILALLIKRDGGKLFYSHTRIGKNMRPFQCHKFRSMVNNPDEALAKHLKENPNAKSEWDQDQKLRNDPRITKIGNFLRKTSLDELPQLWNVFWGDMTLVGPRPVTKAELIRYADNAKDYASVRPGLTGLWQVSGRNNLSYDERVKLDVQYVENRNLWLDLKILLKTFKVLINPQGCY